MQYIKIKKQKMCSDNFQDSLWNKVSDFRVQEIMIVLSVKVREYQEFTFDSCTSLIMLDCLRDAINAAFLSVVSGTLRKSKLFTENTPHNSIPVSIFTYTDINKQN